MLTLTKKEHFIDCILCVFMVLYIVIGVKTPHGLAVAGNHILGKIALFILVVYVFMHKHIGLAILLLISIIVFMKRTEDVAERVELEQYMPSELKKSSQFTAFNQFPYTLEQEIVSLRAPLVTSYVPLAKPTYKPILDDTRDSLVLSSNNTA